MTYKIGEKKDGKLAVEFKFATKILPAEAGSFDELGAVCQIVHSAVLVAEDIPSVIAGFGLEIYEGIALAIQLHQFIGSGHLEVGHIIKRTVFI